MRISEMPHKRGCVLVIPKYGTSECTDGKCIIIKPPHSLQSINPGPAKKKTPGLEPRGCFKQHYRTPGTTNKAHGIKKNA